MIEKLRLKNYEEKTMEIGIVIRNIINDSGLSIMQKSSLNGKLSNVLDYHQRVYCFCYTYQNSENYLLWKLYTDNGKGVYFEFDNKDLISNFRDTTHFKEFGNIDFINDKIRYYEDVEEIPLNNYESTFYKSNHFSGEHEMRFSFINHANESNILRSFQEIDVPGLIKKIILSPFLQTWEEELYRTVISNVWCSNYPKVPMPEIVSSNVAKRKKYMK